ncbi:iron permease [Rhizobium anhuiense]|jgi:high-affinity iron transporter|uniref:Iron permease n=1 Tax=Rhizobium anhuiense TaxID=1184720 RepID=A0ABX4IZC5_9HYPH|nr:FTR1 family protein [Rhizobium anhuiense]PDS40586.1 iron permease [Rhizobium anhuiense]PDS47514.1 iron permease [Rhizobium anhuiense]
MNEGDYLQSFEIATVVWRESLEALLIVGILLAWSAREGPAARLRGTRWIAAGALVGIGCSAGLALVMISAADFLSGDGEDLLQLFLAALAAVLMLRMVFWMRAIERRPSGKLGGRAAIHARAGNWFGLAVLSALAVAREGAETVVFLYGLLSTSTGWHAGMVAASGAFGFLLAGVCFWSFKAGASVASMKAISRASQVLLLILGSGLTMIVVDKVISLGILPPMTSPLWDTAWLLDDSHGFGAFFAGLAGYRSRPELLPLVGLGFYWLVASLAYAPPFDREIPA